MKRTWMVFLSLGLALLLIACASPAPATQEANASAATLAAVPDDAAPEPTAVPEPTATPEPTIVEHNRVSGDFTFDVYSDDTATVTGYHGNEPEIQIPADVDGIAVTRIGRDAFYGAETAVAEVPEGVTDIESGAFANGQYMFGIRLPASVVNIAPGAFFGSSMLDLQIAPENTAYTVADNVLFTADKKTLLLAFGQPQTTAYTIPDSVTRIEKWAFWGSRLEQVTIPGSVTEICDGAFSLNFIKELIIEPENTSYIVEGGALFTSDKTQLISYLATSETWEYTVPDGVIRIGEDAFTGAFLSLNWNGSSYLGTIGIPASVTDIAPSAFRFMQNREYVKFVVSPENPAYVFEDGALLSADRTHLHTYTLCPNSSDGEGTYRIPEGVTSIGDYAFLNTCPEKLTIPEGVTDIGERAIAGFYVSTDVYLPSSLTSFGWSAIEDREGILTLHCPANSNAEAYAKEWGLSYVND